MSQFTATCIYCQVEFDSNHGEGDHVLPASLGEFRGDVRFRGACVNCNNRAGRNEQQIVQSGPESYFRAFPRLSSRRIARRGISRPRGALGSPPPSYRVEVDGMLALAEPSGDDPRQLDAVDQLRVYGKCGTQYLVRLYPRMSDAAIVRAINQRGLAIEDVVEIDLSCDQPWCSDYQASLSRLFPTLGIVMEGETPGGVVKVWTEIEFRVNQPYFQALAKIAFHYYLLHSTRGYRGDETEFAAIRNFIMNGGVISQFFRPAECPFRPGFEQGVVSPADWCHVLMAQETGASSSAYVQLFLGPGCVPASHHIVLADGAVREEDSSAVRGHRYVYDETSEGRFCGYVHEPGITFPE